MFKKIEIWVLYLTILLGFLFAVGFGVLVRQELVGEVKAGWVSKTALAFSEIPMNAKAIWVAHSALKVEDRFPTLDGFSGTPNSEIVPSSFKIQWGFKEGVVELVDLRNFEVLHTWNPDIDALNDL